MISGLLPVPAWTHYPALFLGAFLFFLEAAEEEARVRKRARRTWGTGWVDGV
jgi:hypothetical protein